MPKIIDVALIDVLSVNPGPNDSVEIGGVVFGGYIQNDPNNPSDQTSRQRNIQVSGWLYTRERRKDQSPQ